MDTRRKPHNDISSAGFQPVELKMKNYHKICNYASIFSCIYIYNYKLFHLSIFTKTYHKQSLLAQTFTGKQNFSLVQIESIYSSRI